MNLKSVLNLLLISTLVSCGGGGGGGSSDPEPPTVFNPVGMALKQQVLEMKH